MNYIYYMGKKKSTKLEMLEREREIIKLIGLGYGRKAIGTQIASSYKCTELAGCKQYDKVVKSLKIVSSEEREDARSVFMQRYEYLYSEAVSKRNYKTAGDIIDKQSKLLGLYDKDAVKEEAPKIEIFRKPLAVVPKAENEDS